MNTKPRRKQALFADDPNPSVRVVGAVASASNVDPLECPPLYEAVNPSALDSLFTGATTSSGRLRFEYAGYDVTVSADDERAERR